MKNLGLDLDGVVYNWHHALYTEMQIYEDITCSERDFWLKVMPSFSKEKQAYLCGLEHLYGTQVPDRKLLPMLNRLAKKFDIYYITCRPESVKCATQLYLKHWDFPFQENLYLTTDKTIEVRAFGIDLFVDDRIEILDKVSKFCNVIGIEQFWNESDRGRFQFINNIFQIEDIIEKEI